MISQEFFSVGLSVVFPVYNEIELCEQALRTVHEYMTKHFQDFEIIVVESGSSDGTGQVCDKVAAELDRVVVIHESSRNGMGAALRLGYEHARQTYVVLITADVPFPLETLLVATPLLAKCECVLSYRSNDQRNRMRKIQSWCYSRLVKTFLGLPMRSINSAFKILPLKFVKSLKLESRGWFLDAEILYWIYRKKLSYVEIPVPLIDRTGGNSKVSIIDWVQTLRELLRFKVHLCRYRSNQSRF